MVFFEGCPPLLSTLSVGLVDLIVVGDGTLSYHGK